MVYVSIFLLFIRNKMSNLFLFFVTFITIFSLAVCENADSLIKQKFEAEEIVPDSLDEAPTGKLTITYPSKEVDFGTELTPTEVKPQPKLSWKADPNKYYTLSKVDPDARDRKTHIYREFNHWLVINIKGSDLSTGETLTSYRGSGAPKGTGLHRYIFLIFEQPGKMTVNQPKMEEYRRNFSIRRFAAQYDLGKPIAGNYYLAQWDDSVPV